MWCWHTGAHIRILKNKAQFGKGAFTLDYKTNHISDWSTLWAPPLTQAARNQQFPSCDFKGVRTTALTFKISVVLNSLCFWVIHSDEKHTHITKMRAPSPFLPPFKATPLQPPLPHKKPHEELPIWLLQSKGRSWDETQFSVIKHVIQFLL